MTSIKIDESTLPLDNQKVKWQTYYDIVNEVWKIGIYSKRDKTFFTEEDFDTIYHVHHWEGV